MANEDLIRGGTASVTAGQVTVTGQGVSWANVREGDFFGAHVGLAVPIAAIAGDAITLAFPWTGPTQAATTYAIQPKGDVTRFQDRVRLLVESLANGTLAALTAAGSGANKLSYYTGAGVAALTDFKASARSLLGLTPAADKLPYFTDANTAALATLSAYARSNVLPQPDRASLLNGIGVSADVQKVPAIAADLNAIVTSGWVCALPSSTANCPIPGTNALWVVQTTMWADAVNCVQVAKRIAAGDVQYFRFGGGSTWSAWTLQVHPDFTPVQQGGGVGMTTNKIRMGWSVPNKILAQIDDFQLGAVWVDQLAPSNITGNGYQKLPSGLYIQWGFVGTGQSVTYPIAFPTQSLSVVATMFSLSNTSGLFSVGVATNTRFGATFTKAVIVNGGNLAVGAGIGEPFAWMAMGY